MIKDCHQEITIKDAQHLENIRWTDCALLVKIGAYEVQVGLYRPDTKYFLRLWTYSFNSGIEKGNWKEVIEQVFLETKIEAARCRNVRFIIDTPFYTVIPDELYKEKQQEVYFDFLYRKEDNKALQADEVKPDSLHLIYAIDKKWKKGIDEKYANVSVIHSQTVLLNGLKEEAKEKAAYITLDEKYISVIAFAEGQLQLVQSYSVETALDIIYHILNVVQNLKLSEDSISLFFTGKNKDSHTVMEKLEGRFKQVAWLDRLEGCQFPAEINHYPTHSFYHLVSLALCVS